MALLCGGTLWNIQYGNVTVNGICTDSHEADAETVFCALHGERVDGHDFIPTSLEGGCRCVLCEQSCEAIEEKHAAAIVVKDTELALAILANAMRQELGCGVIGVTGSVGKTTTKDLIASVLSVKGKTFRTEGNRNSVVGMPLSVTEIPKDAQWAVLEMGMNHFGEIERLSVTAEPDVAVITNIGSAHMELLGSRENICRAKLEILCGLRRGGTLLLNGDEPLLKKVSGKSYRTLYVSTICEKAHFFAKNIRVEEGCTRFDLVWQEGEVQDLTLYVMGRHNVYAAMFAFAIGWMNGMTVEEIREGLAAYTPNGLRQHLTRHGDWMLMEDCYNASPESMKAALDVLAEYSSFANRRCVAVLGEMLELGDGSAAMHREVGAYAAQKRIDCLVTLGKGGAQIALGARQKGMGASRIRQQSEEQEPQQTAELLKSLLLPGDVVLFKASRAVGAERIVEALKRL